MGHNGDDTPKKCEGSIEPQWKSSSAKLVRVKGEWTAECQHAFEELKAYLSTLPLLSPSQPGEELFLYLAISPAAVSAALIKEEERVQKLIYVGLIIRNECKRLVKNQVSKVD